MIKLFTYCRLGLARCNGEDEDDPEDPRRAHIGIPVVKARLGRDMRHFRNSADLKQKFSISAPPAAIELPQFCKDPPN